MKSLVHNYTVVSRTYKSEGLDSPAGALSRRAPAALSRFIILRFAAFRLSRSRLNPHYG